jgi:hypothetical protein
MATGCSAARSFQRSQLPVSVAVHGDVVYVLDARDGGAIQGYRSIGSLLALIPTWHCALGLDPNATPEFLSTPGQVAFTPEGGKVLATTKGNTGAIEVFRRQRPRWRVAAPGRDLAAGGRPVRGDR